MDSTFDWDWLSPGSAALTSLADAARFGIKPAASGRRGAAVTGHPIATRIALDILERGGNACDAALAASLAQTVVEPHLTSLTGCLSMMYYEAATGAVSYLNGNVNAPLRALDRFGPSDLDTGRAMAVPGFWAALEAALEAKGSLPLASLAAPAIRLAREGVPISPFLWGEIFARHGAIGRTAAGREVYFPNGTLIEPQDRLVQHALARTLERLVAEGGAYFYHGAFARAVCEAAQGAGGVLTPEDFAAYQVRWSDPIEGSYRGYKVFGATPPDTGGAQLIEMLNLLECLDLQRLGPPTESLDALHAMILICGEVANGAGRYGDPQASALDLEALLSKDYAARRFDLLGMGGPRHPAFARRPAPPGSCHLTVSDAAGNIATVLHSHLSLPWATGLFVEGVSLAAPGGHFLNRMPAPGGRLSVMICPNMIFDGDRPVLASGSPTLNLLPAILQCSSSILDFGADLSHAVRLPRFGGPAESGRAAVTIEADFDPALLEGLVQRGVGIELMSPWNLHNGSFEAVHIHRDGAAEGCGDPRRTSSAMALA
ncbi:MAG: gamma-glutamyltransferase [Caulobacteraceae bacterium]|nr:gamma-glutamyltransferase [Caulobacteraceae bacterium]